MTAPEPIAEWRRPTGDVFKVGKSDRNGQRVVELNIAGETVDLEMEMSPEAARWLAYELWTASGLTWPPPMRFRRRAAAPVPAPAKENRDD